MEDIEEQRTDKRGRDTRNPVTLRTVESLRLARVELEGQLERTTHAQRRAQIAHAVADINRQMADASATL